MLRLLLVTAALSALLGCPEVPPLGRGCLDDDECRSGFVCSSGTCLRVDDPNFDAGPPPPKPVDGGGPIILDDGGVIIDPGEDAGPIVPVTPALHGISDSVAPRGSTLRLEGSFQAGTRVKFPGAPDALATVNGVGRASVTVPLDAQSGVLQITVAGQTVGAVPFRAVSAPLDVGPPSVAPLQNRSGLHTSPLSAAVSGAVAFGGDDTFCVAGGDTGGATAEIRCQSIGEAGDAFGPGAVAQSLGLARTDAAIVRVGDELLVIGGVDGTGATLNSIERFAVGLDGAPGTPSSVSSTLTLPRAGHSAHLIGSYLYVIGGSGRDDVERALVDEDGELGTFATFASLTGVRAHHASAVLGDRLYVLGGDDPVNDESTTIESAAIGGDGELGGFSLDAAALPTGRAGAGAIRIGDALHLFGGRRFGALTDEVLTFDGTTVTLRDNRLLRPREAIAVTRAGNHVILAGGVDAGGATDLIERAYILGGAQANFQALANVSLNAERFLPTLSAGGAAMYMIGGSEDIINNGDLVDSEEKNEVYVSVLDGAGGSGDFALSDKTTNVARIAATSFIAHDFLYVAGGFRYDNFTNGTVTTFDSVERAPINADGSLGDFVNLGNLLDQPRDTFCSVVLGDFVYIMAGFDENAPTIDVARAAISPNGDLGNFQSFGNGLTTGRPGQTCAVAGNAVYVVGGTVFNQQGQDFVGTTTTLIERAPILDDGTLGAFSTFGDLIQARETPMLFTSGDRLLVMGGGAFDVQDVDQVFQIFNTIESSPLSDAAVSLTFSAETATLNAERFAGFIFHGRGGPLLYGGSNIDAYVQTVEVGSFQ